MHKILLLLAIPFFACSEYELKEDASLEEGVNPEIEVQPSSLTFLNSEAGSTEEDLLTITNVGSANLNVSNLQLVGANTFGFTQLGSPTLAPGESQEIYVTYTPTTDDAQDSAALVVSSNDPNSPLVEVPLNGSVGMGMPILQISPSSLDFGTQSVGSSTTDSLILESVGTAPVDINTFYIGGTSFIITPTEPLPLTLDPGETTVFDVTFTPNTAGSFNEQLIVDNADPAGDPSVQISGATDSSLPIADCYVDPAQIQPNSGQEATWYGIDSYDPSGAAITSYNWTLVSKPAGSQVSMPPGTSANRSRFSPDLAGDYVGQLIVTNEFGVNSEPCQTTLVGVPGQDLWVQMSWTQSGDDMDLHMVYNNGGYNTTNDCYYSNCQSSPPDWGVIGDPSDDPSLDQDDVGGTGPENITMASPSSGTYTVVVHDFPGSSYTPGNSVTVVIFLGGVQVWSDTRTISGEDTFTPFAEISYPSATVTPL